LRKELEEKLDNFINNSNNWIIKRI
jgi:hypothetical protein